ncbi:MAG TPA: phospho-N-acetylmuramoyl-pentapeptide-transferase [Anaerolineales bacterium]|nr:phospho-N-acetylmuramoyl-pentapeptide-transferase [Anaerolineales bacterium]
MILQNISSQGLFALSLASITFLLTVIWGEPFIELLRRLKIGKRIRLDGPQSHMVKLGTPTMGGILILIAVTFFTGLLNVVNLARTVTGRSILLPLGAMLLFGLLGAWDDWEGIMGKRAKSGEGVTGRIKFWLSVLLAVIISAGLYFFFESGLMYLPGYPNPVLIPWWLYIPIATFVIISTCHAVNETDGVDGLAGLVVMTCFVAFGLIALNQEQVYLSRFIFTVVGALLAFLWYNVHPASLFMGDVGSLSLGAGLAVVALMTGHWLLLVIIAIVPVAETLSVILQVASAKLSRRFLGRDIRPFKMSPLHHHFELSGWKETQVVFRFWLVTILAAMIGVALAAL